MRSYLSYSFLCLVLGQVQPAAGFPLETNDTGTVGSGRSKLEIEAERSLDSAAGQKERTTSLALALTYGLTDTLDVAISQPYEWRSERSAPGKTNYVQGIADIQVAAKWRFHEDGPLSFGTKLKLTLPSGDNAKGLGVKHTSQSLSAFATIAGERSQYLFDVGLTHRHKEGNARDIVWQVSIGNEHILSGNCKFLSEIGAKTNPDSHNDRLLVFTTLGLSWTVHKKLKLEGGVRLGLTDMDSGTKWLLGINRKY